MKNAIILIAAATSYAGGAPRTFTGVITDSMCIANHKMMRISPDTKCIVECVKASRSVKYVLYDGKNSYGLSDQMTPEKFAGRKVTVTGELSQKTIRVSKIAAVQ